MLELVVLYLGGSLALLLVGPGRFSFDAGMAPAALAAIRAMADGTASGSGNEEISGGLMPAPITVDLRR